MRLVGGINRTRRPFGKPASMIEVCMCQHEGRRRNGLQLAEPVSSAIDHDPSILVLDQQGTMTSVPSRARFDLAPRAEKRKLKLAFS